MFNDPLLVPVDALLVIGDALVDKDNRDKADIGVGDDERGNKAGDELTEV